MATTEKDIKKLGRAELLELLIEQTEENERLHAELTAAEEKLAQRHIIMDSCGSIAEASLKLSGIFDSAQTAAEEYLESIKYYSQSRKEIFDRTEAEAKEKAEKIIADAMAEAEQIAEETRRKCRLAEQETEKKCEEMKRYAKQASEEYWNSVSAKLNLKKSGLLAEVEDEA